jgi:hypothetical protein
MIGVLYIPAGFTFLLVRRSHGSVRKIVEPTGMDHPSCSQTVCDSVEHHFSSYNSVNEKPHRLDFAE